MTYSKNKKYLIFQQNHSKLFVMNSNYLKSKLLPHYIYMYNACTRSLAHFLYRYKTLWTYSKDKTYLIFQQNNLKLSVYLRLLSAKRYEHAQKTINSCLGFKIRDRCRIWNPRNSHRLAQIHGNWKCSSNTKSWCESNFTCVQHLYFEFRLGFRDISETNRVLRIPL